MGSDRLFCFISISKFGTFENPFAKITSLSKFALDADDYFVGTNKRPGRPKPTQYSAAAEAASLEEKDNEWSKASKKHNI